MPKTVIYENVAAGNWEVFYLTALGPGAAVSINPLTGAPVANFTQNHGTEALALAYLDGFFPQANGWTRRTRP
jgi:hypothetical protein